LTVRQSIRLGTQGDPELIVAALVHELGHCLSVRRGSQVSMAVYGLYVRRAPITRKQAKAVLAEERVAWRLGFAFLRKHGFRVTRTMKNLRRRRLAAHVRSLKLG
jgi:hypothetical protein